MIQLNEPKREFKYQSSGGETYAIYFFVKYDSANKTEGELKYSFQVSKFVNPLYHRPKRAKIYQFIFKMSTWIVLNCLKQ